MSKRKLLHRRGESSSSAYSEVSSEHGRFDVEGGSETTMMSSMMNHRNSNGHGKKGMGSRMFAAQQTMENEATGGAFHAGRNEQAEEQDGSYEGSGRLGMGKQEGGVVDALSSLAAAAEGMATLAQRGRKAEEDDDSRSRREEPVRTAAGSMGGEAEYRARRGSYDSHSSSSHKKRNKVKRERESSLGSSKTGQAEWRGREEEERLAAGNADDNDDDDAPWGRSIAAESSLAQRMSSMKETAANTEEVGRESRAETPQPTARPPSTPPSGALDDKKAKLKKKKKKKRDFAQMAGLSTGDDGAGSMGADRRAAPSCVDDDHSTVDHGVVQEQQEVSPDGDKNEMSQQEQRRKTKKKKKAKKELPADAAESLHHYQHHGPDGGTQHVQDDYAQHAKSHDSSHWPHGPSRRSPQPPPGELMEQELCPPGFVGGTRGHRTEGSPQHAPRRGDAGSRYPQDEEAANLAPSQADGKSASKKRRMMKKNFAKRFAEDASKHTSTSPPPADTDGDGSQGSQARNTAQEHVLAALASAATAVKEREDLQRHTRHDEAARDPSSSRHRPRDDHGPMAPSPSHMPRSREVSKAPTNRVNHNAAAEATTRDVLEEASRGVRAQEMFSSRGSPQKGPSPPPARPASSPQMESRSQFPATSLRASPDSDESLHTTASTATRTSTAEPPKPLKKKRKKAKHPMPDQTEGAVRPNASSPSPRGAPVEAQHRSPNLRVDASTEGAAPAEGRSSPFPPKSSLREHEPPMRGEEQYGGLAMPAASQPDEKDLQRMASSPFVMDYAVGLALRYHVLMPVLDDVTAVEAAAQNDRIPYTLGDVVTAGRLLGLYNRGDNVYLRSSPSESDCSSDRVGDKAHYRSAVVTRKLREMTRRGVIRARIEPATIADARLLSSWYASEGDKVLPYTSMDWSNWWMYRCAMPEPGCEMVKLVAVPSLPQHAEQPDAHDGVVLGFAYFERHLSNHHPSGRASSDAPPRAGSGSDPNVFSTLIHAIRVLPHINPTVLKRVSIHRRPPAEFFDLSHAVVDALVSHVCFRSLLFGSAVVGVLSEKDDTTEAMYESHFGGPLLIEENDGRRYFGMESEDRWDRLRQAFQQQLTLRSEWDRGAPARKQQQQHQQQQQQQQQQEVARRMAKSQDRRMMTARRDDAAAMMAALGEAAVMAASGGANPAAMVVTPESSEESV